MDKIKSKFDDLKETRLEIKQGINKIIEIKIIKIEKGKIKNPKISNLRVFPTSFA